MKKNVSLITGLLITGLLVQACKKENLSQHEPESTAHQVKINFATGSININTVDSVTIVLKKQGAIVIKKLLKNTQFYYQDGIDLQNTNSPATINVYIAKAAAGQVGQLYAIDKPVTQTLNLNAPTGLSTDSWKSRFIFTDLLNHVHLVVGEMQEDPYFSITADEPDKWIYAYLLKTALDPAEHFLDNGEWDSYYTQTTPEPAVFTPGNHTFENADFLLPYTNRLKNKVWKMGMIQFLMFDTEGNRTVEFNHTYTKRP